MKIKSLRESQNLYGKRIFLRADLNVPLHEGRIVDDFKIVSSLPTLRFLLRYRAKVVIATHLGEPEGRDRNLSTEPLARELEKKIGRPVGFSEDCVGGAAEEKVGKMEPGDILMLENLRFHPEEKKNDPVFARQLSKLADIYVNDAFAVSHRNHASVSAIKKFLPAWAGLLLEEEVSNLDKILKPEKPMVAIMGGAKIVTKLPLIKNLARKTDAILVGGGLANNFLAARGHEIGKSLADQEDIRIAAKLLRSGVGKKIILPVDVVVGRKKDGGGEAKVKEPGAVLKSDIILDVGPETIRTYARTIGGARTVIWNGPLGRFEAEHFRHGTLAIARLVAARSRGEAFGLVGGGETIEALKLTGMMHDVDWVSTAGGAMLAYLGGEKMPGLKKIIK